MPTAGGQEASEAQAWPTNLTAFPRNPLRSPFPVSEPQTRSTWDLRVEESKTIIGSPEEGVSSFPTGKPVPLYLPLGPSYDPHPKRETLKLTFFVFCLFRKKSHSVRSLECLEKDIWSLEKAPASTPASSLPTRLLLP